MILFNKLVRTDLILLIALIVLLVLRTTGYTDGFWVGFLEGLGAALLFISIFNHIDHYKRTKKLY